MLQHAVPRSPCRAVVVIETGDDSSCNAGCTLMSVTTGFVSSVVVNAMTDRVLPRPIQWAKMAPLPTDPLITSPIDPIVLANKNFTASNCSERLNNVVDQLVQSAQPERIRVLTWCSFSSVSLRHESGSITRESRRSRRVRMTFTE